MFQSLIGRLQTYMPRDLEREIVRFQSLIGRLQTYPDCRPTYLMAMFQSLIGRLQTRMGLDRVCKM